MADTDLATAASDPVPYAGIGGLPPDTSKSIAAAASDPVGRDSRDMDRKIEAVTQADEKAISSKIGADAAIERGRQNKDKQYNDRMEKMISAEGASIDELKNQWKPEQHEQNTGLWESFGSPGFLVAMMGSAFSAMPMNSALTAGGAALDAIHAGDNAAYERAYQAWKDNTKLAIDRLHLEHEEYEDIGKLWDKDREGWRAKMASTAQRFNDQRMLALIHNGMDDVVWEAAAGRAKAMDQLETASQNIEEQKSFTEKVASMDAADAAKNKAAGGLEQPTPDQHWKNHIEALAEMQTAKLAGRSVRSSGAAITDLPAALKEYEEALGYPPSPEEAALIKDAYSSGGVNAPVRIAQIGEAREVIKQHPELPPEKKAAILRAMIKSGTTQARSLPSIAAMKHIQENPGESAQDFEKWATTYTATMREAGAAGTRGGQIAVSAREAYPLFDQAQTASDQVSRGNFVPLNRLRYMGKAAMSDPNYRTLLNANEAAITAYAATMSLAGRIPSRRKQGPPRYWKLLNLQRLIKRG